VFGFVVNLGLGVVGTHVALAAILGLSRDSGRERMTAVATGTGPFGPVGIYTANPAVGPRCRIKLAIALVHYGRAMTLLAAVGGGGAALDDFAQHIIERTNEARGLGMMGCFKLLDLARVAPVAIVWSDDYSNHIAVMVKGGGVGIIGFVTGIAVDALFVVGAAFPLFDNTRSGVLMTCQARPSFL